MIDIKMKKEGRFCDHPRDPIVEHKKGEIVTVSYSCGHQLVDGGKAEYDNSKADAIKAQEKADKEQVEADEAQAKADTEKAEAVAAQKVADKKKADSNPVKNDKGKAQGK